jgi:hypothetical protein
MCWKSARRNLPRRSPLRPVEEVADPEEPVRVFQFSASE